MTTLRFTKQSVALLTAPPGKAAVLFYDADFPGFGVRASAGGSRQFIVQYRPAGQRGQKRLTVGPVGVLSLDEARRQARVLLAQALTGDDPHAAKAKTKTQAAVTLGSVADAYLAHCETRRRPGTLYQVKLHLTKHWTPLRSRPLAQVSRADVAARLNELAISSGGVSANRSRAALSAMFTWAIEEGLVPGDLNPVTGTRKPAEEAARSRVLSEGELAAVWRACRDDAHGRIVRLLILTAQRRDEVAGISDKELDLEIGLWTLPAARAKNRQEHMLPLSAAALTILREAPRIKDRLFVFGEGRGPFSGWSRCKKALDRRMQEVGTPLAPWTLHDLRRTAATMMADKLDVLPHVVEAVLNHTSGHKAGVAGVYNRAAYLEQKRTALDVWATHVAAIVTEAG